LNSDRQRTSWPEYSSLSRCNPAVREQMGRLCRQWRFRRQVRRCVSSGRAKASSNRKVERCGEATKDGADRTCEERAVKRRTTKSRPTGWCPFFRSSRIRIRTCYEVQAVTLPFRRSLLRRISNASPLNQFNFWWGRPEGGFKGGGVAGRDVREDNRKTDRSTATDRVKRSEGRRPLPMVERGEAVD
jgi:hypothetical protein